MDTYPKVCICIPCYNNGTTIAETLESILKQNYPNILVKVFDNASTDNSRNIVESFMEKFMQIELHQRTETVSGEDNFNVCIQAVEGTFSAIFHSDDIYAARMVSEQVNFLIAHEECGAVATHANIIDENSNLIGTRFIPNELSKEYAYELNALELEDFVFKYGNFITCPSVMFRTSTLKNHIKAFHGNKYKTSSDLDVWLRVTEKGSFGLITEPLINYRQSTASYSFNLARVRTEDHDMFLVLDDYLNQTSEGLEKNKLTKTRDFLLMKDRANTNLNRLILGVDEYQSMIVLDKVQQALTSFFHLKYFTIAIAVKLLINIPYHKQIFANLIKRVKFRNG
jgi:glycosyltransferase involved in cell wall biosynthesis